MRLLFGGSNADSNVTLHIYEDAAQQLTPGVSVYRQNLSLTGADLTLNSIDLTGQNVFVANKPFRLGIEFSNPGVPSIARDHDGILPNRNFILLDGTSWVDSTTQGLTGDWILRADVFQEGYCPVGF